MAIRTKRNKRLKITKRNKRYKTKFTRVRARKNRTKRAGVGKMHKSHTGRPTPYTRPQRMRTQANPLDKAVQDVQWLIDLGGTDTVRDTIMDMFAPAANMVTLPSINVAVKEGSCLPDTLIFAKAGSEAGHFIYRDTQEKIWDSYSLKHQRVNTHSFCQTFGLMYLISQPQNWAIWKEKMGESSASKPWVDRLKENNFTHNIIVVTQFWQALLNYPELQNLLISELKDLNNYYIEMSETDFSPTKLMPVTYDSANIDAAFVNDLLGKIRKNARDISGISANPEAGELIRD
jgi:hypothetical protein